MITSTGQQINVELLSLQDGSPCICISVQSEDNDQLRTTFGFFVDHIEYLLKEWYAGKSIMYVYLCPIASGPFGQYGQ